MAVPAQTVSQTVSERLCRGPSQAQVLAVFENACDLVTDAGEVIALVTPAVGNGPLNVVLGVPAPPLSNLEQGTTAELSEHSIMVGALEVDLTSAAVWDPRPDWSSLRTGRGRALARLPALRDLCVERGLPESLLPVLAPGVSAGAVDNPVISTLRETLGLLAPGWREDPWSLREIGRSLTGLGPGLTPSGDDFLIGLMHWAWLDHPEPDRLCQTMVETASRTTLLSSALLRAAARGECSASWHVLLEALCDVTDSGIEAAARAVLAHGATSGADGLAGFIWAGLDLGSDQVASANSRN